MAYKRGNGEGSIYKRKRDGRWVAVLPLGWKSNGTLDRKEFVRSTRGEAVDAMEKAKRDHAEGKPVRFEDETLGHFLQRWLDDTKKISVKPKTFESYSWAVTNHLLPGLGRYQLHKLGPQEVQAFINEKAASDLSVKSIKILRDTLRAALNDAMKWSLVIRNVAALVTLPRSEKTEKRVWSISEAMAFLAAVQGDRLEAVFQLALCFGAREGEILALQWTDVDLEAGFVYVRATQQRVDGKLVSGSPKTGSSRRRIPFTPRLRELLAARKRTQDEERQWAAGDWEETGMIFTTSRGTRLDVSNLMRCYRAAVKRARAEFFLQSALDRVSSEGKEKAGFWLSCQLRYADLTLSGARSYVRRFQSGPWPTNQKGQQRPYTWQDAAKSLRQAYEKPKDAPKSEPGTEMPPAENQVEYIPFHRLRHTAASLMHEAGFPDQDIAKLLGHSTFRTTEDFYLHSTPDAEARTARNLDELFSPVAVTVAVKGGEGKPN